MRRGFSMMASSILTCLVSQRSIAESFSSIGGCSNIGRLPNLSIRPSTRLWRYPLRGHELLLMTSLMNYFPWQQPELIDVVIACLSRLVFQLCAV